MISHANRLGMGEKVRFSKIRGKITYAQLPTGAGSWDTGGGLITITNALTVSGLLTASSNLRAQGAIAAGAANSIQLANNAGESQVWALGTDASTAGTLKLVLARSDLTSSQETIAMTQSLVTITPATTVSGLLTANAGITVTGAKTTMAATVAGYASANLPHGTAPSSPADGDLWTTTAGLFVRINGSTIGPLT